MKNAHFTFQKVRATALMVACALFSLSYHQSLQAGRIEAGSFTAHDTNGNSAPVTISFQQQFDTIPIVIALTGNNGSDPAKIRITNVTTTGFDELTVEPEGVDGAHDTELIHYVAVEPGRHILPGGAIIEAGFSSVSAIQHGVGPAGTESYQTISYSAMLPGTPVVLAHLQSANSEIAGVAGEPSAPFITTTIRDANGSNFRVALERSESALGPVPSAETVGWIAFPSPQTGTLIDTANNSITWSSVNTPQTVRGWQNGCYTYNLGLSSANPIVVAKKSSHRGGDGGWLRRCSLSASSVGITVDEDTALNAERNHVTETAAFIAFSDAFHANITAKLSTTKSRISSSGVFGNFNVPGALIEYAISVTNEGNSSPDANTVAVTDSLPPQLALVVTDFAAAGSGPVQFTDGTPASSLTCAFVSLASPSDCYQFSIDGINFNYTPIDSGDGTDPTVTHIRAIPTGAMAGKSGSGNPNFELRLRARIK